MKWQFIINGVTVEVDEQAKYLDMIAFDPDEDDGGAHTKPDIRAVDFLGLLHQIADGKQPIDDKLRDRVIYLERWTVDAERKRTLRDMRRAGTTVLTQEILFEDHPDSDAILAALANTGRVAAALLQAIGQNGKKRWYGRDEAPAAPPPAAAPLPKSIDQIFAFVASDGDTEGVLAFLSPNGVVPLIAADEARVRSLIPMAMKIAKERGRPYRLLKFSKREDVTELEGLL